MKRNAMNGETVTNGNNGKALIREKLAMRRVVAAIVHVGDSGEAAAAKAN